MRCGKLGQRMIRRCFLTALLAFLLVMPALAANHVEQIDIQAVIQSDGSLTVRQTWKGTFTEGTELFLPLHLPDYASLRDLQVSDESGPFRVLASWDVNASFAEKTNTCGALPTEDGYELCFGIGSYGEHRFTVEYVLGKIIGSYSDLDGSSFCFVNQDMNTTPTNVTLELRLGDGTPLTEENCAVWGLGFDGTTELRDGILHAETKTPLERENHVTVMLSLNKGLLQPERVEMAPFDQLKQSTLNPDEKEQKNGVSPIRLLIPLATLLAGALLLMLLLRRNKRSQGNLKVTTRERQDGKALPNEGNRNATYVLGRLFQLCEEGDCLKIGLWRLVKLGSIEAAAPERTGFLGRPRERNLKLLGRPGEGADAFDGCLYAILEKAAGQGSVLYAEERFALDVDEGMVRYLRLCEEAGREYLIQKRCLTGVETKGSLKGLSERGQQELKEILAFRQSLQDHTKLAGQGEEDGAPWRDDLSYAILFGTAGELLDQWQKVHPELTDAVERDRANVTMAETFSKRLLRELQGV